MQKGKRIGLVALVLLVCTLLSACSVQNKTGKEPVANTTQPEQKTDSNETKGDSKAAPYYEMKILSVGDEAPDFSVSTIGGDTITLSDLRGKVVFINFWASWCGPCINEMPDIQELYDSYSRDDLEIIAVNSGEKLARIEQFLSETGYTFPIAADEDNAVGDYYPSSGIPYTVIVDPNGIISEIFPGSRPDMITYFKLAVDTALGA